MHCKAFEANFSFFPNANLLSSQPTCVIALQPQVLGRSALPQTIVKHFRHLDDDLLSFAGGVDDGDGDFGPSDSDDEVDDDVCRSDDETYRSDDEAEGLSASPPRVEEDSREEDDGEMVTDKLEAVAEAKEAGEENDNEEEERREDGHDDGHVWDEDVEPEDDVVVQKARDEVEEEEDEQLEEQQDEHDEGDLWDEEDEPEEDVAMQEAESEDERVDEKEDGKEDEREDGKEDEKEEKEDEKEDRARVEDKAEVEGGSEPEDDVMGQETWAEGGKQVEDEDEYSEDGKEETRAESGSPFLECEQVEDEYSEVDLDQNDNESERVASQGVKPSRLPRDSLQLLIGTLPVRFTPYRVSGSEERRVQRARVPRCSLQSLSKV